MSHDKGIKKIIDDQRERGEQEDILKELEIKNLFSGSRARIVVKGKVHGVFFRDFVQKKATSLELTGWVCNIDAGVEILAEGKQENINKLAEVVREGPQEAAVDAVDVMREKATGEFSSFEIRRE